MHVAETLRNIFRIPDLRNRILFTLGMLGVYRLGRHVPTPDVDTTALTAFFEHSRGEWFGIMDMFSGGNLSRVTIFALGIMPYISASIILQLLTVVWPYLERLSKEGELGRKKITEYTRYLTVLLSVIESGGVAAFVQNPALSGGMALVAQPGIGFTLTTILTLTAGALFVMWLGEQISERGIGNGMSLLIFAGIVVGFPQGLMETFQHVSIGERSILNLTLLAIFMVVVITWRCCTARSKSLTSLCRLQSHPAQYVSGIPSAAILLSISHPIRCSTRCLANVRARISGPMIAL